MTGKVIEMSCIKLIYTFVIKQTDCSRSKAAVLTSTPLQVEDASQTPAVPTTVVLVVSISGGPSPKIPEVRSLVLLVVPESLMLVITKENIPALLVIPEPHVLPRCVQLWLQLDLTTQRDLATCS